MSMSRSKFRRTSLNRLWIVALRLKWSTKLLALKGADGGADDDDGDVTVAAAAADDDDELIFNTVSL